MKRIRFLPAALFGLAISGQHVIAQGVDTFTKPVRLIVPFAAGGPVDATARAIGEQLSRRLGQPVIVDNKPGANTIIGANVCKGATPDGHNFCVLLSDTVVLNPAIYSKLPYDPERDFAAVANLVGVEAAIVVSTDLPVSNLGELGRYDVENPGKLNWGTFGIGSSAHLYLGQVNRAMNAQINHIPYSQGGAAVVTGLVSGNIQTSMLSYGLVKQWIEKEKIKAVAVVGDHRSPYFPGVPTVKEQGLGLSTKAWIGLFAPKGTPSAAVIQMNEAVNQILQAPHFQEGFLQAQGFTPIAGSPEELAARVRKDRAEWAEVASVLRVKLD